MVVRRAAPSSQRAPLRRWQCQVSLSPARAAQFEFKCATQFAPDHPTSVRLTQMWASVERESGGRMRTQFFPNSVLGTEPAMFGQLRVGALQFFLANPGVLASVVPAADIGFIGFVYKDQADALRILDGPLGAYVRQEATAKGLHGMRSLWNAGMSGITSRTHPIRTPVDLHGFKLRTATSRIDVGMFRALGASPTPLGFAEIYTALQTNIIEGQEVSLPALESGRFFEVEKYHSFSDHAWGGFWLLANADAWKSLPPDLQEIVERNNTKYALLERNDTVLLNVSLRDKLRRQGITSSRSTDRRFRPCCDRTTPSGRKSSARPSGGSWRTRSAAS